MDFNLNDLRTLVTTVSFIVFAGIVYWAWNSRQQQSFDEAAMLPFADEELPPDIPGATAAKGTRK